MISTSEGRVSYCVQRISPHDEEAITEGTCRVVRVMVRVRLERMDPGVRVWGSTRTRVSTRNVCY